MKSRMILALVVGAGVVGALGGAAVSGGRAGAPSQPADPSKMSKDDMTKMMEAMSAPVEQHKVLDAFVGVSDMKGAFSMGPGMEVKWESTSTGKKILGGRFVEVDAVGKPGSKPVIESKSVFGYDSRPGRGRYTLW